jgi:outer membrane protein assembly factor BamE (lipoprotein component of BamABCDE complex)
MPAAPHKLANLPQQATPAGGSGLRGITVIGFVAALVVGIVVATAMLFVMESHPVSISRLSQVSPGTSRFEVERLLGAPTRVESTAGGDRWIYSSSSKWCIVTVRFDSGGAVTSVDHDH